MRCLRRCFALALLAAILQLAGCSSAQAPWYVNCENQAAAKQDPSFYSECMRHE